MKKPKLSASKALAEDLVAASRILAQHGVLDAYGHVSARSDRNPERFMMSRYPATSARDSSSAISTARSTAPGRT